MKKICDTCKKVIKEGEPYRWQTINRIGDRFYEHLKFYKKRVKKNKNLNY